MKSDKGFTLIELLVVIAIIGILSSLILVSITSVRNKAKVMATKQLMTTLGCACDQYYTDWGGLYPPAFEEGSTSRNGGIELLYKAQQEIMQGIFQPRALMIQMMIMQWSSLMPGAMHLSILTHNSIPKNVSTLQQTG